MVTRKAKAAELARLLRDGPALNFLMQADDQKRRVMLWLNSWVTPLVVDLVPELKRRKDTP